MQERELEKNQVFKTRRERVFEKLFGNTNKDPDSLETTREAEHLQTKIFEKVNKATEHRSWQMNL